VAPVARLFLFSPRKSRHPTSPIPCPRMVLTLDLIKRSAHLRCRKNPISFAAKLPSTRSASSHTKLPVPSLLPEWTRAPLLLSFSRQRIERHCRGAAGNPILPCNFERSADRRRTERPRSPFSISICSQTSRLPCSNEAASPPVLISDLFLSSRNQKQPTTLHRFRQHASLSADSGVSPP